MSAERGPELHELASANAYRISPGDSVKLAVIREPSADHDVSVFLEVWDPGGRQPPNSHPDSTETFLFLAGTGLARCDETLVEVRAGQLLVLPARSVHWIENTGVDKLVAITTMAPDGGFFELVRGGEASSLEPDELVAFAATGA